MPVSHARMALTHNLLAALDETLNDPSDDAKKLTFDDALEALLAAERTDATASVTAAIEAAVLAERATNAANLTTADAALEKIRRRDLHRLVIAVLVVPVAIAAGYHFTVSPRAIASRTTALETKTSLLVTTTKQADELQTLYKDQLDEQKAWIKAMWPDHDLDSDGVVDRIDICRGTERGMNVFQSGPVHGCSTDQAAWLCSDLPSVPATNLSFPWDMTNCPAGMLEPGERVTCTFTVDQSRTRLVENNNCQIH